MKIQCPCGAKYVIDVTPGMQPVQFVCPNCGQDYSQFVNELIQRELSAQNPAATPQSSRLKISHEQPTAPPPPPPAAPVSQKKKQISESFAREARFWRKTGWLFGSGITLIILGLGAWIWYAWIASVPHVYFSVRFDQISHSGSSFASNGQIIFLHGGTLARYDLKTKQKIWSLELVSPQQIDDQVKRKNAAEAKAQANSDTGYFHKELPEMREKYARIGLEEKLSLYVSGQNIWISDGNELEQYDWNTGKMLQDIPAPDGELVERGNDLLTFGRAADGAPSVVQIDLNSGVLSTNEFRGVTAAALAQNSPQPTSNEMAPATGGLPLSPYAQNRPMNSRRVAQQAQNLNPAARMALPALIANNSYEQQIEGALHTGQRRSRPQQQVQYAAPQHAESQSQSGPKNFTLIPDQNGYIEFAARLLKANFVQREAMKAPPTKSEIASGANETAMVNEQLNEMQRNKGGDKITENESTYRVTIRNAGSPSASWSGEIVGSPQLFPLKSVNVLAAGKTVVVFDKSNKKLWQADLTYDVPIGSEREQSRYGEGPCVERDSTLYVFDQAVLSAFDLSNGNARWRIPSVGIVGLFFDDQGKMYVNSTTGNPNDIKYSRQIDITKKIENVLMKIDPQTGKILWSVNPQGLVCYVSGKFIYSCYSFDPGDKEDQLNDATAGLENPPLTRILRIDPDSGNILWEHDEGRAAMNAQFKDNSIRLIFKKEVEVLRYLTL